MDNLSLYITICSHVESFSSDEMKSLFTQLVDLLYCKRALSFFSGGYEKLRSLVDIRDMHKIVEICENIIKARVPVPRVLVVEKKSDEDSNSIEVSDIVSDNLSLIFQFLDLMSWVWAQRVCRDFCIAARRPSSRIHFGVCEIEWRGHDGFVPFKKVYCQLLWKWKVRKKGATRYLNQSLVERFYNFSHIERLAFSCQSGQSGYLRQLHELLASLKNLKHLEYHAVIARGYANGFGRTPIPYLKNLQQLELLDMEWSSMIKLLAEYMNGHSLTHIFLGYCDWAVFGRDHIESLRQFLNFLLPQVTILVQMYMNDVN